MPAAMSASNDSLEPRKPQSEEGFSPFATDRAEGPSIDPADVARFSAMGIPAVNYGPGDPNLAHMDDEQCPVEQLRAAEAAMTRWLTREGA